MRYLIALAALAVCACSEWAAPEAPPPAAERAPLAEPARITPEPPAAKPAAVEAAGPEPAAPAAAARNGGAPDALDLRGTEPFWAVRIRGLQLTLMRPEGPNLTAQAVAVSQGGGTTWAGELPDGRMLRAEVRPGECSDGMSDMRYPMTAEVSLSGEEVLKGCATPPAPGR